jgi:hypothetical protein
MANLKIFTNLETKLIDFESEFSFFLEELEIEFSIPKESNYNHLSFGFILESEGVQIEQQSFPIENVTYIGSDQEFMERSLIEINAGTTYNISFWCEESGERFENSYAFTTPSPLADS